MASLPYRVFQSKIDKLIKRIPALGKLISFIFGIQEVLMLELLRFLDKKFNLDSMTIANRYIFKKRWGGKVVPLYKNITPDSRFLPSQEILEILSRSKVTAIGTCYCRETQRKYGKSKCDHPLQTCIHIGTGKSLYEIPYKSENLKKVSKQEVRELLEECDKRGLIHQLIYYPNPQFYYVVCNCCPCCCLVMNKFLKSGSPQMIKSDFIAKTNLKKCTDCGECEPWCYFGARKIIDGKFSFDPTRCFGCGTCVSKCPNNAIILKQKV
ncbi:MAG: 4Fe-4S binding protein [Promethearchaeota archaeon]